jgi:predicted AlkP superfamily pyrophosphatase or phosphodiesterase
MGHRLGTAIGYDANATASQIATVRSGFAATPYANDMLLEFVTRLLDNTELGRDDVPDVLGVSFSATDAVGHDYGPETPEFDEVFRQTDRQINELMDALDRRVGRGTWTLALVADHGASFLPEKQKERGLGGGRLSTTGFRAAVVKDLSPELNDGAPLISAFEPPEFYLDYAEAARRGISAGQLETAVAAAALKQEGIARVYTRSQIMGGRSTSDPILRAVFEGFYPSRSGDIYMVTKPNYIFKEGKGTTHGTPYEYDQHVPLIFYGRGIAPGSNTEHVQINDLAPTLAAIAGIEMPRLPGKVLGAALAPAPARR